MFKVVRYIKLLKSSPLIDNQGKLYVRGLALDSLIKTVWDRRILMIGIIFASGFSRRMGKDKLLLEIEGEKIIEKVIRSCKESNLENIILIYREKVVKDIGDKYKVRTIYNPKAELGQSEAMKLGIKEAASVESYMFFVGDQPFINSELINKLINEYKNNESSILMPYYNGHRGMPMIISSKYKDELLNVVGDRGGRDIVNKYIEEVTKIYIKDEKQGIDIDTLEDLKSALIKGKLL